MKIEVGMYIRTNDGLIRKIVKIDKLIYIDKDYVSDEPEYHDNLIEEDIKKSSYCILDILQSNDILYTECGIGYLHHKINDNEFLFDDGAEFINVKVDEIYSVLTREQIDKYSYKFKSEVE